MPFNHYAKIKRILDDQPNGWFIKRINKPTTAVNFQGHVVNYSHYYRIYSASGEPIKYCKFQQIERLAKVLKLDPENLPVFSD